MNHYDGDPSKEKFAASKKKKKAGVISGIGKKQQLVKKKAGKSTDLKNQKLHGNDFEGNLNHSSEIKSYLYESDTEMQEKSNFAVKSSVVASQQAHSDEDYSDDEEEGEDGYKPGGYHPVAVGDRFNHLRYTVIEKLGWGHFSTVWLCHDRLSRNNKNEFVALKVQKSAPHYREAALDEIDLLNTITTTAKAKANVIGASLCTNFNIVELLDHFDHVGPNGKHTCMAFETLGENLLAVIKR